MLAAGGKQIAGAAGALIPWISAGVLPHKGIVKLKQEVRVEQFVTGSQVHMEDFVNRFVLMTQKIVQVLVELSLAVSGKLKVAGVKSQEWLLVLILLI